MSMHTKNMHFFNIFWSKKILKPKYDHINDRKVTIMFESVQKYILAEFPSTDHEIFAIACSCHRHEAFSIRASV